MDYHDADRLRAELLEAYASLPYGEYLQTDHWQEIRQLAVRRRLGQGCTLCSSDGGGVPLHVHHARYSRLGHEWPEDLIVLCGDCHELYHRRETDA